MTKITLAVTGSIAAYKAADLTSLLTKEGHDVTVLMTKSATQFITPLTLQVLSKNKVHLDIMDEERPELVNHIDLAKNTELFLVAPATADTIPSLHHCDSNRFEASSPEVHIVDPEIGYLDLEHDPSK